MSIILPCYATQGNPHTDRVLTLFVSRQIMDTEPIKLVAQLSSTPIAVTALIISFRTERRNQKRFERQLELTTKIATANIKPLLAISWEAYENNQGFTLVNHGVGTAVITGIEFSRGRKRSNDLAELIDFERVEEEFEKEVIWDESPSYSDEVFYLPGKSNEDLLRLTMQGLEENEFSEAQANAVLESLEQQLGKIKIEITYEDVLGNKMPKLEHPKELTV
jgi:hypothetical protein